MLRSDICSRGMASSSKPPPEERAAEIVNSLPSSPGLVTKTGSAILGTGLLATAISQELYVVNEESVIAAGFFILIAYIYKVRLVFPVHRILCTRAGVTMGPQDFERSFTPGFGGMNAVRGLD